MRFKITLIAASTMFLTFVAFNIARSSGENNPAAVGMGGAYSALARGFEVSDWNPANLGLSRGPKSTVSLFNVGMRLKNNSFTIDDYNRYNGKFLTESDRKTIINSIPSTGLSLDLAAEFSAFNFSVGHVAITYKGYGATSFNLDRDPFKLMLLGNAVARQVSVTDTRGEAFGLGDFAVSYGQAVQRWQDGEFSVGASLHYLKGIAYAGITDAHGGVVTTDTGFVGSGEMIYRISRGGDGYALDMGLAVRFSEDWFFSAAYQNISSKIDWVSGNRQYFMWFDMKPITIIDMLDQSRADSLMTADDTSYSCSRFSTKLTPTVRFGLAKEWNLVTWSFDWEQNLFNGPGVSVNPRLAGGVEYRPWKHMPLRTGLAFGGGQGSIYSIGFGLNFGPYNFDIGFANSGSPSPAHTKGARMALGMSLRF